MPYVVTQPCCGDASCVLACPVNCIHPAPGEPGFAEAEMVFIDAEACVGCGACVTACPVGAIVPDHRLAPGEGPFVALAAEYYDVFPHADRTPVALVPRPRPRRLPDRVRVAVVGAGPAGLYAADELLRHPGVRVDVLDRRDVPHGLARFGVAADHARTREVARLFEAIAAQPGFRYRFGVEVASADQLAAYDAVVWATGASEDRPLDVPGGERVLGATTLARWSNGDPAVGDLRLDADTAIVVGAGNVALDAARLLVGPAVGASEVVVLGRRGVEHAACTTPELVGLAGLADVDVRLDGPAPVGTSLRDRMLADLTDRTPTGGPRITLRFGAPVAEVLDGGVRLVSGEVLAADMVVGAVGHTWTPVEHDRGRVRPGEYVVGWAKRGPTGFIGTNKACAEETVATLLDDLERAAAERTGRAILRLVGVCKP